MKTPYSLKRVVQLSPAFVFALILLIVYSCRKELKIVPLSAADSVDAARSWYEKTFPVNTALGVNNNLAPLGVNNKSSVAQFDFSQYIKPDWNHNARYRRFNKDVIEMPVDPSRVLNFGLRNANTGQYTSAKENSRAWFLLLNDGKKYDAYLMVLIGDAGYIDGDASRLAKNSYRKRDANFSGMLLYFTPKGKFIRSYKYKNGKLVTGTSTSAGATSSTQTQSVKKKTNQADMVQCIDWYDDYYLDGTLISQTYLYTTCDDDPNANNNNDGGGGSPSPPPSCAAGNSVTQRAINKLDPGDGGDDGSGNNDPNDPNDPNQGYPDPTQEQTCGDPENNIIDSLKDTCLKKTLNQMLLTQNINNTIGNLIQNVFNSNSKVNLTYDQSTTLPSTRLGSTDSPPIINIDANGDTTLNITVHLNANVLPGASRELVAMTILHEAIHAYLDYSGIAVSDALAQHVIMGTKYVNLLTSSITSVFPSLSTADANALVLYEMGDINTTSPTGFSNLASTYGLTTTQIVNIGTAYKNQTSGTKGC